MRRAEHQAYRVRDDDADEADEAADADDGRGAEGGRHDEDQAGTGGVDAEARGLRITDRHDVEDPAMQDDDDGGQEDVRGDADHVGPALGAEPPQQPRVHRAQRVVVALLHKGLHRVEEGGHGDPGEDDDHRRP